MKAWCLGGRFGKEDAAVTVELETLFLFNSSQSAWLKVSEVEERGGRRGRNGGREELVSRARFSHESLPGEAK